MVKKSGQQLEEPEGAPTGQMLVNIKEYTMLQGYANLDAECMGYKIGKKEQASQSKKATAVDSKKFSEAGKEISKNIEKLIKASVEEAPALQKDIVAKREDRKAIAELLKEARKPFQEKVKPLTAAIKYIEKVAKPDALHALGINVVPIFTVSQEVQAGIAAEEALKAASA